MPVRPAGAVRYGSADQLRRDALSKGFFDLASPASEPSEILLGVLIQLALMRLHLPDRRLYGAQRGAQLILRCLSPHQRSMGDHRLQIGAGTAPSPRIAFAGSYV